MNKKKIIIIVSIIVGALVIAGLYGTFAASSTASGSENNYAITLTGNTGEVIIPANSSKTIMYQITNTNKGTVQYTIAYSGTNINAKVYVDSQDYHNGNIDYGENKFVKLYIENTGTSESTATIKTILGYEHGGDLNSLIPSGYNKIDKFYSPSINAIEYIKGLYSKNNPTLITHSKDDGTTDTYYYSYQDDTSTWGLMNDGLKVDTSLDATTTGLATTVTDTNALTSGSEGNIRYFGPSNQVNNYIYFNCSDYNNQNDDTCEKWRIIGIVDGKVKLIRDESIGRLAWDQDKNQNSSLTSRSNNWDTSSLNEFLNGLYYDRENETTYTYYSLVDGSHETVLNLETIGITPVTRENNLISESTWYLGGTNTIKLYPNDVYNYERINVVGTTILSGNPYTVNANIGLMYASDYAYGTDLSKCDVMLFDYNSGANSSLCSSNNWLFKKIFTWLINPSPSNSLHAMAVDADETEYGVIVPNSPVAFRNAVFPVLYLDSEVAFNYKGDGTSDNPYQIYVEPVTVIDYITDLYTDGSPELITHSKSDGTSDTYYYSYQDDSDTWGLMNDGLKIDNTLDATTTGLATAVTDTNALTSGSEGNIRYFGPSDKVNNYIYFNCSDYNNQSDTTCAKWRIVGIVDGKVKIISRSRMGTGNGGSFAWDQDKNLDLTKTSFSNNWENSSIQLMLNSSFYNGDSVGTITYYSGETGNVAISVDMGVSGLKNDTTRRMISKSSWYLGGYDTAELYPDEIYKYERTNIKGTTIRNDNPFSIGANIGLVYASDYGYATNLSKCSKRLSEYNDSTNDYECRANNWLYTINETLGLISPRSTDSSRSLCVQSGGNVAPYRVDNGSIMFPVIYLNPNILINNGEGTSSNPYKIHITK